MNHASAASVKAALHWRYATKKFDESKRIPAETWAVLEESLVLTPSSYGLQPWHFVVVDDPTLRARLAAASFGQQQPVQCSHFVVFAVRKQLSPPDVDRHIARIAEVRGVPLGNLKGYRDLMVQSVEAAHTGGYVEAWSGRQLYIALGQFMAAAAVLGIDASPMEGLLPAKYDEILGLPERGYTTLVACAAGYRAADDLSAHFPKVRFPAAEVVSHR